MDEGLDPRAVKAEKENHNLLGSLCESFMSKYVMAELRPKTQVLYKSIFNKYVTPYKNIDIERYKYTDRITYFDWVKKESSSANAGSVLKRFKAVANWAKARGQIKRSHLISMGLIPRSLLRRVLFFD